jgi:predicted ATP-grasp superfamily ATP-dependent carboligase
VEPTSYQGPTGIVGVFQNACVEAGIPAISFWASVPHYVSQARVPKAAVALLHRIEEVLDVEVPLGALPDQAEEWERTVSEMAEADDEVREYVRQLEEQAEATADDDDLSKASGDEIAADFERYLRRRGQGGGGG